MNLINEKLLNDYPKPVFIEETEKILRQMKKSVWKYLKKMVKKEQDSSKIPYLLQFIYQLLLLITI